MKIIGTHWFTGISCFGIVVIETEVGERKAYIGLGVGLNEKEDAEYIAAHGVPVMKDSISQILTEINGREEKK